MTRGGSAKWQQQKDLHTNYRGYDIQYGLNSDVWECWKLDLTAETLTKLKSKIDRMIKKINDQNGVSVLYIGHYGMAPALITGTVIKHEHVLSKDPKKRGIYERMPVDYLVSMDARGGQDRTTRHVTKAEDFAPDTADTHRMLAEHKRLVDLYVEARKKANDYLKAIPRVTMDMFKSLTPDDEVEDE